jgi:NhaA family Na+:H+ antiporter
VTDVTSPDQKRRGALPRFSQFAVEHLLLLPLGAAIALVWVAVAPESYYRTTFSIAFAVNDVAMAFFFALMTKEVVEATAPGGVLHSWRRVALPLVASIGAVVVPAVLYTRVVDVLDEPMLSVGWPVTLAVDIAVSYFVARVVFRRHPAIPFLLLLAIGSDVLAFVALASFNPARDLHLVTGGAMLAVAIAVAMGLRRAGVKSFWPYVLVAGSLSWFAFFWSGFQSALALVPIVPFLPHAARDRGLFVDADPDARDALSQFENFWRYPVHVTLFLFGIVNAGVPLHAFEAGAWGLPIAVLVGRPLGIMLAVGIAVAAGLRLPHTVGWRELLVVGFASAIGFTIGLFLCAALLSAGQLRTETSMGVLMCLLGAPLAILTAKALGVGRFARR